ncbi:intracellular protein transport protein uso1-like isoform X1 [Anarrhichthys ocellatus]|uniref:intracellular protein transport protein uso1-like isoform X1 n=1 Tax=Anarrhichthys ocellatus TaxID=433405 RepID=UPI0012ED4F21|nr:intracellular protein transport protein uso1-like isoform X1 [Anarrhichthys ocellatus]
MKSVLFLLLFFSVSWGQLEASVSQEEDLRTVEDDDDVPPELPVLWDELRGLKDLVLSVKAAEVEQRQAIRSLETRLRDGELEDWTQRRSLDGLEETVEQQKEELRRTMEMNSDLRRKLEEQSKVRAVKFSSEVLTLHFRLNASERSMDDLKKKNSALAAELPFLQTRLRASENTVEQLRRKSTVLSVRLCNAESLMEELMRQPSAFPTSNSSSQTETELEEMNSNTQVQDDAVKQLQVRLNSAETQIQQLQTDQSDQTSKPMKLQRKVNTTESLLDTMNTALEVRLSVSEKHLEDLKTENTELEVRLRVSEKHLEELKTENTVQSVQLSLMESRLTDSHNKTTELEVRLRVSDKQLEDVKTENTVLSFRLNETDNRLTNTNSGDLKVAFSAGLTDSGSVGPFDEETTLIFSKTITNIGQAYNQTEGVFTAPVRGLYFFSFTAADYLKGYMGLHLYRNNQPVVFSLVLNDHGGYASMSGGVALQLEEGDGVRLSLPASYRLYDDSRNFSVFSGFLLFPL